MIRILTKRGSFHTSLNPVGYVVAQAPWDSKSPTWKVPVFRHTMWDMSKYAFRNKTIYNPEGDFLSHYAQTIHQIQQARKDQLLDRPTSKGAQARYMKGVGNG